MDSLLLFERNVLTTLPPLTAYRRDLTTSTRGGPFGNADDRWLEIATLVRRVEEIDGLERAHLLDVLAESLGAGSSAVETLSARIRELATDMEDAGAFQLATSLLTSWQSLVGDSVLEMGRIRWQRARIEAKLGFLDSALDHYATLEDIGRARGIAELEIRSWIGYGVVAQLRGNYPALRRRYEAAIAKAEECGLPELAVIAHHGYMIGAAVGGDLSAALHHGWRAFLSLSADPRQRSEVLVNIAELLLRAELPAEALTAFSAALEMQPSARIELPALGGLARAAAAMGDNALVRQAHSRALTLSAEINLPYQTAASLAEIAGALARIGDAEAARQAGDHAAEIANHFGFHELVHRAETLASERRGVRSRELRLDAAAELVVSAVRSMPRPESAPSRFSSSVHQAR